MAALAFFSAEPGRRQGRQAPQRADRHESALQITADVEERVRRAIDDGGGGEQNSILETFEDCCGSSARYPLPQIVQLGAAPSHLRARARLQVRRKDFRFMHLNIFRGAPGIRKAWLADFVSRSGMDLLCMTELLGWTEASLTRFALSTGYQHTAFLQTFSKYNIGCISTEDHPMEVLSRKAFKFHGALHVNVSTPRMGSMRVIATHLTPFSHVDRNLEAKALVEIAMSLQSPCILLGDMNSLLKSDAHAYEKQELLRLILSSKPEIQRKAYVRKFLDDRGKALDFSSSDLLLQGGLKPIGTDEFSGSVPTLLHGDSMHLSNMRLDYAFTTTVMTNTFRVGARIVKNLCSAILSDHFPLAGVVAASGGDSLPSTVLDEAVMGCPRDVFCAWSNLLQQEEAAMKKKVMALRRQMADAVEDAKLSLKFETTLGLPIPLRRTNLIPV